jgi:GH18 family chitinase
MVVHCPEPSNITSSTLTHILYSFADVDPNSGTISLTDSYADEQVKTHRFLCRILLANTFRIETLPNRFLE